jgi:hypothetical protein
MENIVIELSRYTSTDSPNNAVFTTNLKKPVIIEQGDEILIKQAFLDTRQIDQNSIEILDDIQWTLQFGYYMINHGINQKQYEAFTINIGNSNPDGLPYLLSSYYDPNLGQGMKEPFPLIDSFVVNIPQGIYEKSYLAEFITRQMQEINTPQNITLADNYFTNGQVYLDSLGNLKNYNPPILNEQQQLITSFQKPLYLAVQNDGLDDDVNMTVYLLWIDGNGNYKPCGYFPLLKNQNYNYPFTVFNLSQFLGVATTSKKIGEITLTNPYNFQHTYDLYDAAFIGASEMAFVYDDEQSNKYSFQYMHTPIINSGNECVGFNIPTLNPQPPTTLQNTISYFTAFSGILIMNTFTNKTVFDNNNKFVSDEFFSLLGMSYNDIITPDIQNLINTKKMTPIDTFNFKSHTTRNFFPQSALSDTAGNDPASITTIGNYKLVNYSSILQKTGYQFIDSQTTDEIIFSEEPTQSTTNGGHYLIDIKGYENEYIGGDKDYQIKAIIPNYFLSGDSFCQSIAPDSYSYQHTGVPINLCKITTKILNPITKLPEVNLKGNSTIYLMVIKQQERLQQQQKEQKETKKN